MDDIDLNMRQQAVLLTLMAEARELTNAQLKAVGKVEIGRGDRERLVKLGLISHRLNERRAYVYQLTRAGWNWCDGTFLNGSPPPRSGTAAGALYAVLRGVRSNLKRSELDSSSFFGPTPEQRVRAAYAWFAGRSGALVGLRLLRTRLSDMSREDVDAALDVMSSRSDVTLMSQANRKILTAEDREAAITIGGQSKHVLIIQPEPEAE